MAYTDDLVFYPRLLALQQCLCQEITDRQLPPVCFCGIIPGQLPIADYVGSCTGKNGMAWVRLVSVNPMPITIPGGTGFTPCGAPLEGVVEVGIVRSAPGLDSRGNLPTVTAQHEAARLAYADMAAGYRAVTCCLSSRIVDVISWTPIGPEGGIVGGAWQFTLAPDA